MNEPTIDLATFTELQNTAGADFVAELVSTFLEEAPGMLAELRAGDRAPASVTSGTPIHRVSQLVVQPL